MELEPGENNFGEDNPVSIELAEIVATTSTLYLDDDGDRAIGEVERRMGPVASASFGPPDAFGEDPGPDTFSTEGMCNTGGGTVVWWWIGAVLAGLSLRARRRP